MKHREWAKKVLAAAGVYDPCGSALGIRRLRRTDTFLVSYPRSGNTWMRFLIANALNPNGSVLHHELDYYVPDVHGSADRVEVMKDPRIIKTHGAAFECYPKWIYMVRDGRDALTSFYYYCLLRKKFSGTFSDFLRSRRVKLFDSWTWAGHACEAVERLDRDPERGIVIRYEDVLRDPGRELRRALDMIGIEVRSETIESAVERSGFDNLQKLEDAGKYVGQGDNRIFRKGSVGEWREMFSEEDEKYFMQEAEPVMARLGYV